MSACEKLFTLIIQASYKDADLSLIEVLQAQQEHIRNCDTCQRNLNRLKADIVRQGRIAIPPLLSDDVLADLELSGMIPEPDSYPRFRSPEDAAAVPTGLIQSWRKGQEADSTGLTPQVWELSDTITIFRSSLNAIVVEGIEAKLVSIEDTTQGALVRGMGRSPAEVVKIALPAIAGIKIDINILTQNGSYRLAIRTGLDGNASERFRIRLSGPACYTTYSNDKGIVVLRGIPPGEYQAEIKPVGKQDRLWRFRFRLVG